MSTVRTSRRAHRLLSELLFLPRESSVLDVCLVPPARPSHSAGSPLPRRQEVAQQSGGDGTTAKRAEELSNGSAPAKGKVETIGVTGAHPFWSIDRNAWVPAAELRPGERLLGLAGPVRVVDLTPRPQQEPVYNIEVDGDHVYRVGEKGLLVHNASVPCEDYNVDVGKSKILREKPIIVRHPRGSNFQYVKVEKFIANLQYQGSDSSRDPDPWTRQFIRHGTLQLPGTMLGLPNDDVGHILANQFGGYANEIQGKGNIYPQNATVNRVAFRIFEQFTVAPLE